LVGYHSRLLGRLDRSSFGVLGTRARQKIDANSFAWVTSRRVEGVLADLRARIGIDCGRCERVRRLCAILRFSDAIDVDRTRIPAPFITLRDGDGGAVVRNATNNREYVKRQVVGDVYLQAGEVRMSFDCPPPLKRMEQLHSIIELEVGEMEDLLVSPWAACHALLWVQVRIKADAWLDGFWHRVMDGPGEGGFSKDDLNGTWQAVGIRPGSCLSEEALCCVASVASLAVLGEIREEYQAIEDCGLSQYIRLALPVWSDNDGLSPEISVLSKGVPQYDWQIGVPERNRS
jgi:hypothetical protein